MQKNAKNSFFSDALGCSLSGKALRIRVEWEQACAAQQSAIAAGSAKNSNWWSAAEIDQFQEDLLFWFPWVDKGWQRMIKWYSPWTLDLQQGVA